MPSLATSLRRSASSARQKDQLPTRMLLPSPRRSSISEATSCQSAQSRSSKTADGSSSVNRRKPWDARRAHGKWSVRYPRLTSWVEETIEQTLTFFRLPRQQHKHLKSTNMLERLNEEIRRGTYVVRIFPSTESCLRLVRALAVETHENWMEANRYINMDDLREHKKLALRQAA